MTIKQITIEIKKTVRGYPVGHRLKIRTDKNGTPMERYWRDRLKDAAIDGCIKVVKKKKKSKGD